MKYSWPINRILINTSPGKELTWFTELCICAQSLQSCPTLCGPTDCSPPGLSVQGILQVRILEWVAMPSWGIQSAASLISPALASRFFTTSATWEAPQNCGIIQNHQLLLRNITFWITIVGTTYTVILLQAKLLKMPNDKKLLIM